MRRLDLKLLTVVALLFGFATGAEAQGTGTAIDADAVSALKKMSSYLRDLKAFQVEAVTSDEDVLDDGQKITYSGVTSILAKPPSNLRAEVTNDRIERTYLYDGKNFTLYAKRLNYYATAPAPSKILDLADKLEEKYGFSLPLVDLFRWSASDAGTSNIKAAMTVGPSAIDGTTCVQYAFREDDIDWQIWIQRGDYPLPRKIVITTKTDEARPEYSAVYTWNLAPSFNEATFKFDPPPGAERVTLPESATATGK